MPNGSDPPTPPSTAPTSPTSPTSTNGLIDCEKGNGRDNQDGEWNEKGTVRETGQYITRMAQSSPVANRKQVVRATSLGPTLQLTGRNSLRKKTPLTYHPNIEKRMEGQFFFSEVWTSPVEPRIS